MLNTFHQLRHPGKLDNTNTITAYRAGL